MPFKRSDIVDAATIAIVVALLAVLISRACGETVVRVIDGDTLVVEDGRHIRLTGIDAPELKQPGGPEARRLLELYALDRDVELRGVTSAAWGRVQATVIWRKWDLGGALVQNGRAWASEKYLSGEQLSRYMQAQTEAKTARKGLWADDNPVAPWDWRAGVRPVTAFREFPPASKQRKLTVFREPDICIGGS